MKKSSKNSKIELSIIIVNYNTGKFLEKCVSSIVRNTNNLKNPACEIIIVDNNSTDRSAEFKRPFRLIKNKDNLGFSKANNQGIIASNGGYILLLNPDTEIIGGAIAQLLEFSKQKENAGVVVPQLLNTDESVQDSVMPFPTISRAISEFWFGHKTYSKFVPNYTEATEIEAAVMAAFMITPKALKKVGLLDERYFLYFEDLDYCRRVGRSGLKIYYLPSAEVVHCHGVSGGTMADNLNQWRRLIPSSKIYHGVLNHYLINIVIKIGQKVQKILK